MSVRACNSVNNACGFEIFVQFLKFFTPVRMKGFNCGIKLIKKLKKIYFKMITWVRRGAKAHMAPTESRPTQQNPLVQNLNFTSSDSKI